MNCHALSLNELWLDLKLIVSTDFRLTSDLPQRFLNNSLFFKKINHNTYMLQYIVQLFCFMKFNMVEHHWQIDVIGVSRAKLNFLAHWPQLSHNMQVCGKVLLVLLIKYNFT